MPPSTAASLPIQTTTTAKGTCQICFQCSIRKEKLPDQGNSNPGKPTFLSFSGGEFHYTNALMLPVRRIRVICFIAMYIHPRMNSLVLRGSSGTCYQVPADKADNEFTDDTTLPRRNRTTKANTVSPPPRLRLLHRASSGLFCITQL